MKKRPLMINRRKTLLAMIGAWGAGLLSPALARLPDTPADTVEKALREDLTRLGERAYSEEGIPVFLACVDLVAPKNGRAIVPTSALSRTVASDLRKNGEAWLRIYPKASDGDVSKLIELLAERDFGRSRTGDKS